MTIEERAVKYYGTTQIPEFAVWMTKEGILMNGSHEGHQRDVDHQDISRFFKRSKFEDPGSSAIYLYKFMRRGNIRMGCSESGYCMELTKHPTLRQLEAIMKIRRIGRENGIETYIGRYRRHKDTKWTDLEAYLLHLDRYTRLPIREFYMA